MAQQNQQTNQKMQPQQNQQMQGQAPSLSDSDILKVALTNTKHMAEALNTFALESQNDNLRRDYLTILGDVHSGGKQIFDLMQQKGYYSVKTANPQDVAQAQSTYSGQQMS
jgi:spore coat protein CotF